MVDAVCVHPATVHLIWPQVKHWIKCAMERADLGRFDVIEADALSGRVILWLAVEKEILGAAVTQITVTERSKVCVLQACGGVQFKKWMCLLPVIEQYARLSGCNSVRFEGRKGWERLIQGYTQTRVIMEKAL